VYIPPHLRPQRLGSLSDPDELREVSYRRKRLEDELQKSSKKEDWRLGDLERLNHWRAGSKSNTLPQAEGINEEKKEEVQDSKLL
jgi:hypothetical protein